MIPIDSRAALDLKRNELNAVRKEYAMSAPAAARRIDLDALTDSEIAELARQKVDAAYRVIMRRYNRRLYRIARTITRNDSEAEDALQEAYLRAFTNIGTFRGESSLATWLTRIVLNEALGRVRRARPTADLRQVEEQSTTQAEIIAYPSAASTPDPERTVAQRQIQAMLERAIDELPEAFRVVLVARAIENMSVEETAALFALRTETVKTRLHRARKLLRDALEKEIGPILTEAFPFDGARCTRLTEAVLDRLALAAR